MFWVDIRDEGVTRSSYFFVVIVWWLSPYSIHATQEG